ncbi:MAG: PH domain-containing protein [Notoacmeibacter sp.]|nr:PH domain-containing protein [Notoacmeibacter sp.]
MKQATNDNQSGDAQEPGGPFAVSLMSLFLPAAVIAGGYGALLGWLSLNGGGGGAVARLALGVLFVGVPVVVAHAALRAFTTGLKPLPHALQINRGFPRAGTREVPYPLIERIVVLRGIGGRKTGSGTLVFHLAGDLRIAVCDLKHPEAARAAVEAAARAHDARQKARQANAPEGPRLAAMPAKS